jgi:predicted acetyltransferase
VLIAAEWPIYGRFGYAPATVSSEYVLQRSRPGARCDGDMSGIRQVELETAAVAVEVFERARWHWAGQMDRDEGWWQRTLGLDGNVPRTPPPPNWLTHQGEDGVDGILGWSPEGEPSLVAPAQRAVVSALFAATDAAYRDLWSYLTALDGIDQVRLSGRPVHDPVRWLLDDARTLIAARQVDFLWLRLLDIPAALRGRRYAVPGELVLEVSDHHEPAPVTGRYRLIADRQGRVQCEPTRDEPDLEITQRTLASIYLGGYRLAEMRLAGGAREFTSGSLDRLDLMFSWPLPPWNATWF